MSQLEWGYRKGEHLSNVGEAASPEAIVAPGDHKLPLYDNDPTRNVTPSEKIVSLLLVLIALAALLVLAIATAAVLPAP